MPHDESNFNLLHSRTRMTVKRAFGHWKNKFRVYKTNLLHHDPKDMARMIEATLVLHNWYIEYGDAVEAQDDGGEYPDWIHIGGDIFYGNDRYLVDGDTAVRARDRIKEYLASITME